MFSFFRSLDHDAFLQYVYIFGDHECIQYKIYPQGKDSFLYRIATGLMKINKKLKYPLLKGTLSDLELGWSQSHSKGRLLLVIFTPTSHYSFLLLSLFPYRLSLF